jgi:hypothetical protein
MIAALSWAMILVAISVPIVSAFVGMRLRWSIVESLVPGVLLVAAASLSLATAWGHHRAAGSGDVTNAGALFVAAALTLMAGALGVCIAGVVTRVRRGSPWSRGA